MFESKAECLVFGVRLRNKATNFPYPFTYTVKLYSVQEEKQLGVNKGEGNLMRKTLLAADSDLRRSKLLQSCFRQTKIEIES